jgi:hypothetical protein
MTDEKIIGCIAGIMNAGGFTEYSFLGKGKVFHPENAMIITDKRVILVLVPLPGAGEVIEDTNISLWQLLLAKKDIENKLKEMLSSMTLNQIMQSSPKNHFINLEEIKQVKISWLLKNLIITTKAGKKYKYSIRDKEDREKAKKLFQQFM